MNKILTAISVVLLCSACAGSDDEAAIPDWEAYKASATRVFEGETSYVMEGDLAVTLDELRHDYLARIEAAELANAGIGSGEYHSTVNRVRNRDDVWSSSARQNLTYCINNAFGSSKSRVVDEMARATADWEAQAGVNFTYVPAQDANCRGNNRNVTFAVRPWTSGGACAFFPSGGGCVTRTLVINIPDLDQNYAPVTTLGVFRHELGHILGLRHEHIRNADPFCGESGSYRALTAYDTSSVMHYPWCPGATNNGDLRITSLDANGSRQLYP
jgi:Dual-action HEIGH metallo-peptidase